MTPVLSLLLAASPVPVGSFVPFSLPPASSLDTSFSEIGPVETFDPVGRAALLAAQLPRQWRGSYQSFGAGAPIPVELRLDTVTAMGQMIDLRGTLTVGSASSPVQGNLNAKSDQLELIPLIDNLTLGLEPGGDFIGLQGFSPMGWNAPRLTNPCGRLVLDPVSASALPAARPGAQPAGQAAPIRGLW